MTCFFPKCIRAISLGVFTIKNSIKAAYKVDSTLHNSVENKTAKVEREEVMENYFVGYSIKGGHEELMEKRTTLKEIVDCLCFRMTSVWVPFHEPQRTVGPHGSIMS